MLDITMTLMALVQKMSNAHLQRTDTDQFYIALVDQLKAIVDTLRDGVVFPDGTVQRTALEPRAPNINTIKRGKRDATPVDDVVATFLEL